MEKPGGMRGGVLGSLTCTMLLVAAPLHAQTAPPLPADAVPEVPAATETLPPLDPVIPDTPPLLQPLTPLGSFDATPAATSALTGETAEATARYGVTIEGLDPLRLTGTLKAVSELWKGRNRPATAGQLASRIKLDTVTMRTLLESEGHYGAVIDSSITPRAARGGTSPDNAGGADVLLRAEPGKPYVWSSITLDAIPPGRGDLALIFGLKVGQTIRAAEVEKAEADYRLRLANIGFPFADLGPRDVEIDDATQTGSYLLTGTSGPIGRIGRIRMEGYAPFGVDHAQVIARFRPGDRYSAVLTEDFRRALVQTQLFAGVTIKPVDTGERTPEGDAITDIVVNGNQGPLRALAGQAGYSTSEGVRVEAQWRHRNLVKPEGQSTARIVAGTIEQALGAEIRLGNFRQRDRTVVGLAEFANITRPAFQAKTLTVAARISRDSTPIWQKRWTWSAGFELVGSDERDRSAGRDALGRRQYLVAALPLQLGFDTSDDLLDPTSGYRLTARVSPEAALQGGRFRSYARLQGDVSGYQRAGPIVIAGRIRLGSITGIDRAEVAPTRRLYAGGGGSVRGYDFQGVGPRSASNTPLGGLSLVEGSVEARYRFGDFGAVAFVDAGQAYESSTPSFSGIQYGAGVGGRYYTPFGPLRFDIARAINRRPFDPKFAIYISIGQSF